MKTKLCIGIFLLAATCLRAQTNDLTALLQQGLFEEQASRNLDAAIATYQSLAAQFDKNRQLAATAVFRLGECYRAQGRTNEAAVQYQRIIQEFGDQSSLATLSRQDLAGMGMSKVEATPAENSDVRLWNELKGKSGDELAKILPTLIPDATLDNLLQKRSEAQSQRALLMVDYGTNNATILRVDASLAELSHQIGDRVKGMMEGLKLRASLPQQPALAESDAGQQQKVLLGRQLDLAEQNLADLQKKWPGRPVHSQVEIRAAEQQVFRLQQELAALQSSKNQLSGIPEAALSEEDKEIAGIQQMIQNSPDLVNAANPANAARLPLVGAAHGGQLKVAAYLLDHGADVNGVAAPVVLTAELQQAGQVTPLLAAVAGGNRAMAKLLIDRGADVNFKEQHGKTSLHLAALKGFQAVVEVLLAGHADVNAQDESGLTPLFSAVQGKQLKIVQMLVAAGAKLDLKDDKGWTVLNYAVGTSPAIFKALLDAGADPNTQDADGLVVLSYATDRDTSEVVKLLLAAKAEPNRGSLDSPLLCAIHARNVASAEMLLQAGANPNARGNVNWDLVINGLRSYGRDKPSVTPLGLAVKFDQLPMVQLLLRFKADPNEEHEGERALLFDALSNTNILAALLEAGAKVEPHDPYYSNNGDKPDWTPLAAAVWRRSPAAVGLLLQHGANPNAQDDTGNVPLHWAVSFLWGKLTEQHSKIVELLLERGANPNVQNRRGFSPLDWVKNRIAMNEAPDDRFKIAALLRQHGALDKLPNWDAITLIRPAANFSYPIFRQGTNDWNQFTLLEAIANFYNSSQSYSVNQGNGSSTIGLLSSMLPFPDLTRVVIIRPQRNSTNETRLVVNLLNPTNGIDVSKDMPLMFGDAVEIAERNHSLGEKSLGLGEGQRELLTGYVKGTVRLEVKDQHVDIPFYRLSGSQTLSTVLGNPEARQLLLSSSDLSQVKLSRRDVKTGQTHEWVFDCSALDPAIVNGARIINGPSAVPRRASSGGGGSALSIAGSPLAYQWRNGGSSSAAEADDFWLCNGDVISVPEKQ